MYIVVDYVVYSTFICCIFFNELTIQNELFFIYIWVRVFDSTIRLGYLESYFRFELCRSTPRLIHKVFRFFHLWSIRSVFSIRVNSSVYFYLPVFIRYIYRLSMRVSIECLHTVNISHFFLNEQLFELFISWVEWRICKVCKC